VSAVILVSVLFRSKTDFAKKKIKIKKEKKKKKKKKKFAKSGIHANAGDGFFGNAFGDRVHHSVTVWSPSDPRVYYSRQHHSGVCKTQTSTPHGTWHRRMQSIQITD
jgi:hypothetical protein